MKIRTHEAPKQVWGKSMTIPDQSYTVKQLFERFRKGLPVDTLNREAVWNTSDESLEVDLEKVGRMSAMDKADYSAELRENLKAEIEDRKQTAKLARQAAKEAEKQAKEAEKTPQAQYSP